MAQNQTKRSKSSKTSIGDKELSKKDEATKKESARDEPPQSTGVETARKSLDQVKSARDSPRKPIEQSTRHDRVTSEVSKKNLDQAKGQEQSKGQGARTKTSPTKKLLKIERNQSEAKKILCQMNSQLTELLLGRPSLTESPTDLTRRSLMEIQNLSKDIVATVGGSSKKSGSFTEETAHLIREFSQLKLLYHKSESNLKSEKDLVKYYTNKWKASQNELEKLKVEKKQTEDEAKKLEDKIIELENSLMQTKQSHHNGIRILTDKQAGLQEKLNNCEYSLTNMKDKNKELSIENQSLQERIQQLEQKSKSLEKKCHDYHKEVDKVTHKNKLLDNRNKKLQSDMDMMNVKNIELRSKNKSILKESNHTDERVRELEEKLMKQECELEKIENLQQENHYLKLRLSEYDQGENESDIMKIEDYAEALQEQEVRMLRRRSSENIVTPILEKLKRENSAHSMISCANSGLSSTLESHGRVSRLTRPDSILSDVSFANSSHSDEVPR